MSGTSATAMPRVAVLGGGSWGTTVATLASQNAPTTLWVRDQELARSIARDHENPVYLPKIRLPEDLRATDDLGDAVSNADLIVMGAYGHSRFREAILGGATRYMLEQAEIPVLMAH